MSGKKRNELPVVAPVAKHDVPDNDQTPTISEHLEREIDRAPGPMCTLHLLEPRAYCSRTACRFVSNPVIVQVVAVCKQTASVRARRRFFAAERREGPRVQAQSERVFDFDRRIW